MNLSSNIRAFVEANGGGWRGEVVEWWLALADAWEDDALHAGGKCGAVPCLLHSLIAATADRERGVYSRADAVAAYRNWRANGPAEPRGF